MHSKTESQWVFQAGDAQVFRALRTGTHTQSLREYFGAAALQELSHLARIAYRARRPSAARKVLILPGIMGSKLGETRAGGKRNILWIDPLRIAAGQLTRLELGSPGLRPVGVMLFTYAKLKLSLDCEGHAAEVVPYDWRLSIDLLGKRLARRIGREPAPVTLVAHSMGGLVARAALRHLPKRCVRRVILLGVPNLGTFAALQALRGTYPSVRKIAMLDLEHSAEYLTKNVFSSFAGLYQLLPPPQDRASSILYDANGWPGRQSAPDQRLLELARNAPDRYAPPDARLRQIVSANQNTITSIRRTVRGFEYQIECDGDGTVPLASARLTGVPTYYAEELHSNLANNAQVIGACADLISQGHTQQLSRTRPLRRRQKFWISDAELRRTMRSKIDWRHLDSAQRESLMSEIGGQARSVPMKAKRDGR